MIVFFALLGVSCKRKIPEAHTSLEVVRVRYGRVAHVVFLVLCLVNNIFACANMLLGASAVISAMLDPLKKKRGREYTDCVGPECMSSQRHFFSPSACRCTRLSVVSKRRTSCLYFLVGKNESS
jgi:hypothetical protein